MALVLGGDKDREKERIGTILDGCHWDGDTAAGPHPAPPLWVLVLRMGDLG